MPADLDNSSAVNDSTVSGEASVSSSGNQVVPMPPPTKKKRNLPGMPDPDSEVIALSPKTLLATNRFICEICNKGFQRDQNLQLHRRGHNLPWKLRQRSSNEIRKRVYVCPEPSCVHHHPSRALGDLTGIKKHFCRKHGEKKWKCEKCSKKYAVQSDWKAHLKVCGTREYKCDCGTLFSRRDSFITHRAFCDALAEESAKVEPSPAAAAPAKPQPPSPPPLPPAAAAVSQPKSADLASSVLPLQNSATPENPSSSPTVEDAPPPPPPPPPAPPTPPPDLSRDSIGSPSSNGNTGSSMFAGLFRSSSNHTGNLQQPQSSRFTDLLRAMGQTEDPIVPDPCTEPVSLCLAPNYGSSSIFGQSGQDYMQYVSPPQPALSATALLQKAAQIGATSSNGSLLRALGIVPSGPSSSRQQIETENSPSSITGGLRLGLPCDGGSGLKELMMGTPSLFGPKQITLDFLGLGMAAGGGQSALMSSMGGGGGGLDTTFGGTEFNGNDMGRSS
ncbi:zinc finger protein GAI-ASSOCIATED FACTOR 1-like isoform X2 [Impatiens glandulifera]|uniref:zinc finger protein GAI-ASSOCIATED FACTOR 1-like isoform X2 n=1 Tax=Impatiens glandulifera TaxID=253017 RepID=UPI001FB0C9BE|nr:zinc finger protein GAI-ASSOCIATED FACTOR 1-like isoform X2 [Impatiens glandulifera]